MRKNIFLSSILLLIGVQLSSYAQKGTTEISAYGGAKSYTSLIRNPGPKFDTFFGVGVQLKHHVSELVFLTVDFNGGTDGGTDYTYRLPWSKENVNASQERQDFNLVTGVGLNFVHTPKWTAYAQAMIGVGTIQGNTYDLTENGVDKVTKEFSRTRAVFSTSLGCDYQMFRDWKVGLFYTNNLMEAVDLTHVYGLKISFVLPK